MARIKTTPKGRAKVKEPTAAKPRPRKPVSSGPVLSSDEGESSSDDESCDDLDKSPARNKIFGFETQGWREATQPPEITMDHALTLTERFEYRVGNPHIFDEKNVAHKDNDPTLKRISGEKARVVAPRRLSSPDVEDTSEVEAMMLINSITDAQHRINEACTLPFIGANDDNFMPIKKGATSARIHSATLPRRPRTALNNHVDSPNVVGISATKIQGCTSGTTSGQSSPPTKTLLSQSDVRLPRVKLPSKAELLKAWARLQAMISAFATAGLFERDENKDTVQGLQQQLTSLAALINGDVPSSPAPYNDGADRQVFLCHGPRGVKYILEAQHSVTAIKNVANKTYGYIRFTNTTERLMGTYSGWLNSTKPGPYLLDVEHWFQQAKYIASHYQFHFKAGQIDRWKHKAPGSEQAGHSEIRLALWFACFMVRKKFKHIGSDRGCYAYFHKLKSYYPGVEADILLSHCNGKPCQDCRDFVDLISDLTGIIFHFLPILNVGFIKPKKTARGQNTLSTHASDTELQSFDSDYSSDDDDRMYAHEAPPVNTGGKRKILLPIEQAMVIKQQVRPKRKQTTNANDLDLSIQIPAQVFTLVKRSVAQVVIPFSAANASAIVDLTQDDAVSLSLLPLSESSRSIRSYRNPTVETYDDESDDPFKLAKTIRGSNSATHKKRAGDLLFEKESRRDREDEDFRVPKSRSKKRRTI